MNMDLDFIIADTNILIKLLIKNESYGTNVNFLVKKNLTVVLLKTIASLHPLFLPLAPIDNSAVGVGKMDEAIHNIYTLLIKLAKYEPKLPIMSRLHDTVNQTLDIIQFFIDKQSKCCQSAFQGLKIFCAKNGM